jgi:predicted phage-related endonuclease
MQQQTPEWLEFRKNKIGASDAPIIMETSPWKTPYQLWLEKLSLDAKLKYLKDQEKAMAVA